MPKYMTKPREVEAHRIPPGSAMQGWIASWCGGWVVGETIEVYADGMHNAVARIGDWIVQEDDGYKVLTHEEFLGRYEATSALGRAEMSCDYEKMTFTTDDGVEHALFPPKPEPVGSLVLDWSSRDARSLDHG